VSLGKRPRKEIWYTQEQCDRLEKVLRFRGLPAQTYQLSAVMRSIEADEAEMAGRRDRKRTRDERSTQASGMGLFRGQSLEPATADPQPAPVPVVVNVGGDRPTEDLISRLAQRVTDARDYERESRKREALSIIKTYARDDDERRSLAEKLNEEIERRADKSPASLLARLTGGSLDKWKKGILG
jgi:hypothetical protein